MSEQKTNLSSPFSTGGGGYNFENSVQTYFAMYIIMGEKLPFCINTEITKMKLQGHYDGYNTDDCILFGKDSSKCLCQIKHTISITEKDEVFHDIIRSAWNDFCNKEIFDPQTDQIVLIVSSLSNSDNSNTRTIIDWAHFCENETEFTKKIFSSGFSSADKQKKYSVIKKQLESVKGNDISDYEIWDFLKHFNVIALELDRSDTPIAVAATSLFSHSIKQKGLENNLYRLIAECNQNAGTVTREILHKRLGIEKSSFNGPIVDKIFNHNSIILKSMHNTIDDISIDRSDYINQIEEFLQNKSVILVSGERGVGKTGIIKSYIDIHNSHSLYVIMRAEELNKASIDEVFSSINWDFDLDILNQISLGYQNRYFVIESLERILENEHSKAFVDLISFIKNTMGWKLLASIRHYAINPILINLLAPHQLSVGNITINKFSDAQLNDFIAKNNNSAFKHINDDLFALFRTPIYLDYMLRTIHLGYTISEKDTYQSVKKAIWENVIENSFDRMRGLPIKRGQTFINIALQRAQQLKYEISSDPFEPEVLQKLENDSLITIHDNFVAIVNDVLEDWALEKWIEQCYCECHDNLGSFFHKIGYEQSICRAYRLWLIDRFNNDTFLIEFATQLIEMERSNEYSIWIDETIVAVISSNKLKTILTALKDCILSHSQLLEKISFTIRVTAKTLDDHIANMLDSTRDTERSSFIRLKPVGSCWTDYFAFLYEFREQVPVTFWPDCIITLTEWIQGISSEQDLIIGARDAGLLALHCLNIILSYTYPERDSLKSTLKVAMTCYKTIDKEFDSLIESTIFNEEMRNHHGYVREMAEFILTDFSCHYIIRHNPQMFIKIAKNEWMIKPKIQKLDSFYNDTLYEENEYGFSHNYEYQYYPASGYREPFVSFFSCHPRLAMDFVIDLCNTAVKSYLDNNLKGKTEREKQEIIAKYTCKITKDDGSTIEQIALSEFWCAYRGISTLPSILKCSLMALENNLLKYFNSSSNEETDLDTLISDLLSKSNSVLITAVVASVVTAHCDKIGRSALLLLQNKEFYEMDLHRQVYEHDIDVFLPQRFGANVIYYNERKTSNNYAWRKETLETLCFKLQFTELRESIYKIIDDLDSKYSENNLWQFCKKRIDSREYISQYSNNGNDIILSSKPVEGNLKILQDKQQEKNAWFSRYNKILQWSSDILDKKSNTPLPTTVTGCITEIKKLLDHYHKSSEEELVEFYLQGINQAIAVLLRDYSNSMKKSELKWCTQYLLNALEKYDHSLMVKSYKESDMKGIRSFAKVFPTLVEILPSDTYLNGLMKLLTSFDVQMRFTVAKSISEVLWDIDRSIPIKCINVIRQYDLLESSHYSSYSRSFFHEETNSQKELSWHQSAREKLSLVKKSSKPNLSIEALSLILTMLPVKNQHYSETKEFFTECIYGICSVEQQLNKHDNSQKNIQIFFEVSSYNTEQIGTLFYNLSDIQLSESKNIIEQIALKAPRTCRWVIVHYRLLCSINNNFSHYWRFWNLLTGAANQISIELNKGENYRFREEKDMLIEFMFACTDWQPADYINRPVDGGVNYICSFAKENMQNPLVYEGLASLMYHFPQTFLEKGILAHTDISPEDLFDSLRRSTNGIFYMENNLFAYITQLDTNFIPAQQYKSCRKILDALIQLSSSKAYYLREYLLKSKKAI